MFAAQNNLLCNRSAASDFILAFDKIAIGGFQQSGYPSWANIDEFRLTVGGSRPLPSAIQTEPFPRM